MLSSELVALLNALVPPEVRWRFLRTVLQDVGAGAASARVAGTNPDWFEPLSEVPAIELIEHLRRHAPDELAAIDALAESLIPTEQRLGRVAPLAPTHVCLVGRTALIDELLSHPEFPPGGHLHIHGPRASGRSLVASQLARQAADTVPVVAWLDGRTPDGLAAGLQQLAVALGYPPAPPQKQSPRLTAWLRSCADWCVVVDDAPDGLPACLQMPAGRLITIGTAPRVDASMNVPLPSLDAAAREAVTRRWSRGRAQPLPDDWSLAVRVRVAAASARAAAPVESLADAVASLSVEARFTASLLSVFAAAPVPFVLLRWPGSVPVPDGLPDAVAPLLRSERICRAAVSELVRAGWAHWANDALVMGEWDDSAVLLPEPASLAALLMVHALHASPALPFAWQPHVRKLADDPAVPSHVRRAIAARAGRLALEAGNPQVAVEWFQAALAALDESSSANAAASSLLNDLGVAWRRTGRLEEAAAVFRDALARDEQQASPDSLSAASTRTNLAHVLRDQGHMHAARDLYAAALAVRRAQLGEAHLQTGAVAVQLGVVCQAVGDLAAARTAWSDAIRGLSRCRPTPRVLLSKALQKLARLTTLEGHPHEALPLAQRAYTLLMAEHDDMDHPSVTVVRELISALDHQLDGGSERSR